MLLANLCTFLEASISYVLAIFKVIVLILEYQSVYAPSLPDQFSVPWSFYWQLLVHARLSPSDQWRMPLLCFASIY